MTNNTISSIAKPLVIVRCSTIAILEEPTPIVETLSAYDRLTTAVLGVVQGHPISCSAVSVTHNQSVHQLRLADQLFFHPLTLLSHFIVYRFASAERLL